MIELNKQQCSRLLYTNPVCILSSKYQEMNNLMVISWITPINNSGDFILSLNKKRYSSSLVLKSLNFILNVPIQGMENILLEIGKCSGESIDKLKKFKDSLKYCGLGRKEELDKDIPISIFECISHMYCEVNKVIQELDENHYILHCSIKKSFVDQNYWKGNQFIPLDSKSKPYLTFLGSQTFGYIHKN